MKKIYILLIMALAVGVTSCESFLEETPNKSGSAYIYHMDQLYGLTGNPTYYNTGYPWTDFIIMGDGVEFSPYYVERTATTGSIYQVWSWDTDYLESQGMTGTTWTPAYNAIYAYNTVLESLDKVIQTTPEIRKQVEGEALFGRAYFHFLILSQYCLWDEDAPGIGYRTNTLPTAVVTRETVKYTLDKIYQDLDDSEALLTEVGRTIFEPERNFRPTIATVKALRARIDLYRGNYTDALANAEAALAKYNNLHDFINDELYKITSSDIYVLDESNEHIVDTIKYRRMTDLQSKSESLWKHPEFYLPHRSDLYYGNRSLPISQSYYNLFDHENDARWKMFYDNNYIVYSRLCKTVELPGISKPQASCFTWEDQQGVPEANRHAYIRFTMGTGSSGKYYPIGLTTAEMYLTKAECLARAGKTADAANVLKTLRRTRFTNIAAADNIGGSLQEVLDERAREMTEVFRFFDIKRLNGADKANIKIKRNVLTDYTNINSAKQIEITPDDPRWAIPIDLQQRILMGWE